MTALAGVKVLDLSRLLPGPFASMVLGDLGAQVDKIEDAGPGDYMRHMPPQLDAVESGLESDGKKASSQSAMFLSLNRNKRSATLDLKKPAARDALLKMVARYDVLLEQFRPGVLDRLGLSHAKLLETNPRLVICALTGYGQDGPLAHRAGHDINYLARAGLLGFQGPANGAPQPPGFQLADIGGALWSVIGILAALAEREKTGNGKVVDIAMLDASMGFAAASFGMLAAGVHPKAGDEALTGGLAIYGTYATKDGRAMSLGALEPKFWNAFAAVVGHPADMSDFLVGPHQVALKEKLRAIFLAKTQAEWIELAMTGDYCLEPVLAPNELENDPQIAARGLFFDLPSRWGSLLQTRTPVTPKGAKHAEPPLQGEHTRAILEEAGLSEEEIAKLTG
ncbi:MAG: CaiB/BaiF CoA-transferase family protein, partial [Polyangiaceae bacterium]